MNKILNEIANLKTPIDIVEYAANRVAYLVAHNFIKDI